jgi:TetR/AcrR family transcriptional repressor of nem operon
MTTSVAGATTRKFTAKGLATRQRIVEAASDLILVHGLEQATLEEIQTAAHVSASQLYHYFDDKSELLLAVIDFQSDAVLGAHRRVLEGLDTVDGLVEWRDMVLEMLEVQRCVGGCPLGSLASGLAEVDPVARIALARAFTKWEGLLRDGLATMRDNGEIRADVDVESLALGVLAGVQGGLLLSQTHRDTTAVRASLDLTIAYVRTLRP